MKNSQTGILEMLEAPAKILLETHAPELKGKFSLSIRRWGHGARFRVMREASHYNVVIYFHEENDAEALQSFVAGVAREIRAMESERVSLSRATLEEILPLLDSKKLSPEAQRELARFNS